MSAPATPSVPCSLLIRSTWRLPASHLPELCTTARSVPVSYVFTVTQGHPSECGVSLLVTPFPSCLHPAVSRAGRDAGHPGTIPAARSDRSLLLGRGSDHREAHTKPADNVTWSAQRMNSHHPKPRWAVPCQHLPAVPAPWHEPVQHGLSPAGRTPS